MLKTVVETKVKLALGDFRVLQEATFNHNDKCLFPKGYHT